MSVTRKNLNIRGFDVRVHTYQCVVRSLTEDVDDVIFEAVDDFLRHGTPISKMVDMQTALVEIIRYFLQDTCTPELCVNYSAIGDDRNNLAEDVGSTFNIDVSFTPKNSLVSTRIRYTITY